MFSSHLTARLNVVLGACFGLFGLLCGGLGVLFAALYVLAEVFASDEPSPVAMIGFLGGGIVFVSGGWHLWRRGRRVQKRRKRLVESGLRAPGRVVVRRVASWRYNRRPVYRLTVEAEAAGGIPFRIEHDTLNDRIAEGDTVEVAYDTTDRDAGIVVAEHPAPAVPVA